MPCACQRKQRNAFGPKGWTPERLHDQKGKTFLITGANAGVCYQAARILLSKGAKVVMLNRSAEKSTAAIAALKEEFAGKTNCKKEGVEAVADASFVRLDLGDLASVREAAANVLMFVPRIDALICNGAIAQIAKQELTVDGFESQLLRASTTTGTFCCAGFCLRASSSSRVRVTRWACARCSSTT